MIDERAARPLRITGVLMALAALVMYVPLAMYYSGDVASRLYMTDREPLEYALNFSIVPLTVSALCFLGSCILSFTKGGTGRTADILYLDRAGRIALCVFLAMFWALMIIFIMAMIRWDVPISIFIRTVVPCLVLTFIFSGMHLRRAKKLLNAAGVDRKSRPRPGWAFCGVLLAAVFTGGVLLAGCNLVQKNNLTELSDAIFSSGNFSSFEMQSFSGETVTEEVLKGHKITVFNIWGTTCTPCINEMPDLDRLAGKYSDEGLQIIGICMDASYKGKADEAIVEEGKRIIEKTGISYLNLIPSGEIEEGILSNIIATPTTIIVDENGTVLYQSAGASSYDGWEKVFLQYLA